MNRALGVNLPPGQISSLVVADLLGRYQEGLPLIPGAVETVRRLARRYPLALASSANREVIEAVLDLADLREVFAATVSSEEVPRGKPAPDVYLEAVRRLGQLPPACAAVEDSASGIRSALAAGLHVVAVPNRSYPPPGTVLAAAGRVVSSIQQVTPELIDELGGADTG
jgi:HAD superfamily hydrolase (TIGR01509 family)